MGKLPFILVAPLLACAAPAAPGPVKACDLLTQADVQLAAGAKAGPAQTNAREPQVCAYSVVENGNIDLVAGPTKDGESADALLKSTQAQMKMAEVKGLGDRTILIVPAFGMIQLNTYKGTFHLCLTVQLTNTSPEKLRAVAEQLMRKLLARLQ